MAGAKLLAGGKREGALYDATVLEGVPAGCDIVAEEAFGPVVVLQPYATFRDAIARHADHSHTWSVGIDMSRCMKACDCCTTSLL